MEQDELEAFYPECLCLGVSGEERAIITAPATQGELDAAGAAAEAAGARILSRITVLEGSR